jgi:hypothetical protein
VPFLKRRAIGEGLISVGALCALVALLATFDPRVKQEILTRVNAGNPAGQMASAEATVRGLTSVVMVATRDYSLEHAPMVTFVLLAVVLFVVMLRT